ncbi:MAG: transposase [Candidatus Brocadiaceae bacterium]|nr:transposase [Candidatus Brocadiaceae bacterium]
MLLHEDISKTRELKIKFKEIWLRQDYLISHLEILGYSKIKKHFESCKKSGISFDSLISTLLVLPIMGLSTIYSLAKSNAPNIKISGKDSYYRLLANQNINWRGLLMHFVKEYLSKDSSFTSPDNPTKCLVFDDTDIAKTGKTIEGISKIHNHVSNLFYFGFKLLVAGYWNGSIFIPVDFSFHRESKKSKYGLTSKQRKKQKSVFRCKTTKAYKRYSELNKKKTDMLISMFSRICKRKIIVDYILIDTWFTSVGLIKKILKINPTTHVIGMYKYNSKIIVKGEEITLKNLKLKSQKPKRCRRLKYYYHHYISNIDGIKVSVFQSRRGVNGKWHTIITTDTSLSFVKVIEIYSIRWTIEVFFKEAKQLFKLGTCQSTNFDVQIAQTTITMIQYLLTSIRYRMEAYETIGGLFRKIKQDYIEHKLNIRILAVINQIMTILERITCNIDFEMIARELINNSSEFLFLSEKEPAIIQPYKNLN